MRRGSWPESPATTVGSQHPSLDLHLTITTRRLLCKVIPVARRRTGLGGGGGLTNYTALLLCLPWWGAASPASRCCSQAGGVNIVRGTRAGADCGMTTG